VLTRSSTIAPMHCAMFTSDNAPFTASAQPPSGIHAGG
jgi:hypothetical protein